MLNFISIIFLMLSPSISVKNQLRDEDTANSFLSEPDSESDLSVETDLDFHSLFRECPSRKSQPELLPDHLRSSHNEFIGLYDHNLWQNYHQLKWGWELIGEPQDRVELSYYKLDNGGYNMVGLIEKEFGDRYMLSIQLNSEGEVEEFQSNSKKLRFQFKKKE